VLATGSPVEDRDEVTSRIESMDPLLDLIAIALSHSRLYRDLRSSEERLRQAQKMEAVGQLAAGLAHNFNNMLQALMGNLELSILESGESIRKRLADAISVCERKSEMIKQLMLFSRNAEVTKKRMNPAPVIDNALEICEQTFDKSIELRAEVLSEPPDILGDPSQIEQVLLNLCINAQDALVDPKRQGDPRRLEVNIDLVDRPDPAGRVNKWRRFVRICVHDNGLGMDESTRRRIFEPFFTTKKVGQGTGLGLAMAYGIIKEHGGWIDCDSQPGSGTIFSVYLPALEGSGSRLIPIAPEETPGGTETVLLIEDEVDVLRMTETMLSRYGYTVLSARDGEEGLDQFRRERERIDLILLDLSMPRMSGQEFLNVIRAESPCPRIIISTGHIQDHGNGEAPDALMKKPYRLPELLQTVRRVLDQP
jgi:signal transduction histidine kinase